MPEELAKLLTVAEVAAWLRLKPKQVYVLASAREIPCIRVGRALRFPTDAVSRWLSVRLEGQTGAESS